MIIKELNLNNFGKFSGKIFCFHDGFNVIYGPNEAGKTTLYTAIGALLFGMNKQRGRAAKTDAYTTYQPWENKTWYEGSMRFESGGKIFYLERNFYHNEKAVRLICETDGEELSVEDGDLEMLLGDMTGELYFNTAAAGQLKMKPQDIVYSYLKNYIASVQEAGSHATDVVKALGILEGKKKVLEQQKKKQTLELNQQIAKVDAGLELVKKEISDCQRQLEHVKKQRVQLEEEVSSEKKSFLERLFYWLKKLFCGRRLRAEEQRKREELLKIKEKMNFLKDILGEKESLLEELGLEKDSFYEKLHIQSKDEEIKALDLAMERIRELSTLRKEEVMEQLLIKASAVLSRLTKGKYQKLILEENEEPCIWDGNRKLKLFQVSTGCADQIYLALRIGLQDLFLQEETLPLLFDDAFVYFDDERLEKLLSYLSELDRQVLIFSCHKRELRILEKCQIPYGKIVL
ncbi:MAG: AAA family ATPase [Lachnospiraceae bacterium]|nr:AAA family ATPase [Lachnospiraceae bacterium]